MRAAAPEQRIILWIDRYLWFVEYWHGGGYVPLAWLGDTKRLGQRARVNIGNAPIYVEPAARRFVTTC